MKYCKVDKCNRKFMAKEMCNKHYYEIKRNGKLLTKTIYDPRPAAVEGIVAKIKLGLSDKCVTVDKELANLDRYKWSKTKAGYAQRIVGGVPVLMHRELMNMPNCMVDHINGDRLDNRLSNLRLCTPSQNVGNAKIPATNTTGYKGVKWHVKNRNWVAQLAGKHIGCFNRKEDAVEAYNQKALEKWGEFARLNVLGS